MRNNPVNKTDPDGHFFDPGDKFKTKNAAAVDAVIYIRKQPSGYNWEYGTHIHQNADKTFTYNEPVTQQNPRGVDLPQVQKNDVADVHTHNDNDPKANSIELPDKINSISTKHEVQLLNGDVKANVDYDSYVGAPNGNVLKFTPNSNAPDGLGNVTTVQKNVAPAPATKPTTTPQLTTTKKEEKPQ